LLAVAGNKRTRYSDEIKEQVRLRYPLCRTTADKQELAEELGIDSVSRLYNLASRLEVAGAHEDQDPAGARTPELPVLDLDQVKFTRKGDQYIRREFGRRPVEDIAFRLRLSETAVMYRARKLKLRKPVKFWDLQKVISWLKLSDQGLQRAQDQGLETFPLAGLDGQLAKTLVSTSSLARWLKSKQRKKELLAAGADPFFILEIEDSVEALVNSEDRFELCSFLSQGHVCMNPLSRSSYGYYCTNNEVYKAGDDPKCQVKILRVEDLAPEE
jgi:hypothetical protein